MKFEFRGGSFSGGPVGRNSSIVAKLFASIFFVFFGGMGLVGLVAFGRELLAGRMPGLAAFFLLIPLTFVAIALGSLYFIWFGKPKDAPDAKTPKAKMAGQRSARLPLILFGLVFLTVGLVVTYFLLVRPLVQIYHARGWVETPCKIVSAKVGSHNSDDGTTYSIDITYQYEFNGATHTSDRYDFVDVSSSGYKGKKRVVDQYKNAANPVCYVNPDEPEEAVLQRDLTIKNAIGLFPLIFVAVGAAILVVGLRQKDRPGKAWLPRMKTAQGAPTASRFGFDQEAFDATPDAVTLRPNMSPLVKLGLVAFACLFWNGIVSVFVYQVVEGFRTGNPEWFLTVFMIPFVLVGLGLVVAVFYVALTLFNPRYTLTLRPGLIQPGTTGSIAWKASGSAGRIQQLSIKLVGQEKASYTVGTDTRTEEKTFFESDLVDTRDLWQLAAGEVEFAVPADAMHSFESAHNKIVWSIKLHGHIALWPDVSDEYKIAVLPARLD